MFEMLSDVDGRSVGISARLPSSHLSPDVEWASIVFMLFFVIIHLIVISAFYCDITEWLRSLYYRYREYRSKDTVEDIRNFTIKLLQKAAERGVMPITDEDLPGNSVLLYYADKRDKLLQEHCLGQTTVLPEGEKGMDEVTMKRVLSVRIQNNMQRHIQRNKEKMELESISVKRMNWKRWMEQRLQYSSRGRFCLSETQRKQFAPKDTMKAKEKNTKEEKKKNEKKTKEEKKKTDKYSKEEKKKSDRKSSDKKKN